MHLQHIIPAVLPFECCLNSDAVTCINSPSPVREAEALTFGCELDYYGLRDVDVAKRPTLTFDGAADDQVSTRHQSVTESTNDYHRRIV